MKLKITKEGTPRHSELVTSLGWTKNNELYTVGEDQTILKWSTEGEFQSKVTGLDQYPTSFHWHVSPGQEVSDVFVIAFSDGTFNIVSKTGRIEKTVDKQHQGAISCIRWNHEGSALATIGEDGKVLQWSRSGNLRSKLSQLDEALYTFCWSPSDDALLIAYGSCLLLKPLQVNESQMKWKAHNGVVLSTDWNPVNNLIVSGGEDCRYNVWDRFGRLLYSSTPFDYSVTAVKWAPGGDFFAASSFNAILLCDKTGWAYSRETVECGSILEFDWTSDGMNLAGAASDGSICFGQVVDRRIEWGNFEILLNDRNQLIVRDLMTDGSIIEEIDFRDRVIEMSMGFDHLVVATCKQVHVFSTSNLSTPHIFDVKGNINLILQCKTSFLVVNSHSGVVIYGYDGRKICTPQITGVKPEFLKSGNIALTHDTLVVIDSSQKKLVHMLDSTTGKAFSEPIELVNEVDVVSLSQCGIGSDRKLTMIDRNRDLWVTPLHNPKPFKLAGMVSSMKWSESSNTLAAVVEDKVHIWYYLNVVYVDRDLLPRTTSVLDTSMGQNAELVAFTESRLIIRRQDGALISQFFSPYPVLVQKFTLKGQWAQATQLARLVDDPVVWSCLAAMAINGRELDSAEVALAAIEEVEKLMYIQYIKKLPLAKIRDAELALYRRKPDEAESILLQSEHTYRAINLNLRLFRWKRALKIAVKSKTHVDTVVAYRQKYLADANQEETDRAFLEIAKSVAVDWEDVRQGEENEIALEYEKAGLSPPTKGLVL